MAIDIRELAFGCGFGDRNVEDAVLVAERAIELETSRLKSEISSHLRALSTKAFNSALADEDPVSRQSLARVSTFALEQAEAVKQWGKTHE